ncbi:sugar ABC transporter permease [Bacillus sp. EB106-08-02-XG196]|jgi:raffinose/stachyose/melibiose transport system permease protein|uniref:carbohydrate ABC transporter permease n=1 Tax=Bacillus sp. EB106-08-02-XG196 TaxID=2737049 RepID=UPI0015C4B765|nr:sugar ABC transporter permease [Bacillus sp. EB106-08-02-XG196]NWQ42540.1 sugar ABC transporter permease [Bacillus sp. EB106-08-02-XG196]
MTQSTPLIEMDKKSVVAVNSKTKLKIKKAITIASFLLPGLILYAVFMLYPMIDAVRFSFFDWDGASPSMNFVGIENYVQLTKDDVFLKSLGHNLLWVVLSLTLMVVPTLVLAVLISRVKKGKVFFRAGFYLPSVLSLAVVGVLWSKIYDPMMGPINVFLKSVGLESLAKNWLGEPLFVIPALVIASTWAFYGLYLILFLAGLQSIDYSLYEAADIDGAGPISKFWNITIPSLRNTLNVVISMVIIHALKGFALIWIMTQGGPFYMSELVSTYVYKAAFSMNKVSYATAGSVVLGIIVIAFTIGFNYYRERTE